MTQSIALQAQSSSVVKSLMKRLLALIFTVFFISSVFAQGAISPATEITTSTPGCVAFASPISYIANELTHNRLSLSLTLRGQVRQTSNGYQVFFPLGAISIYESRNAATSGSYIPIFGATVSKVGESSGFASIAGNIDSRYAGSQLWVSYSGVSYYGSNPFFCGYQFPIQIPGLPSVATSTALSVVDLGTGNNDPTSVDAGSSVMLFAGVATSAGAVGSVGGVSFFDGTSQIGSGSLNAAGVVSMTYVPSGLGSHALTARFAPSNTAYQASTSSAYQLAVVQPTSLALTAPSSSVILGKPVTLTVQLTGGNFSGSVSIKDGNTTLTTLGLDATGKATYSASLSTPGVHNLTASYSGDVGHKPSASPAIPISVYKPNILAIINLLLDE
jgi:hypothetical protein